jgi:SMC interacting uncharacterized protein involved in chromosome segregation
VTICVGILFLKKDGIDSSPEIPKLIREQFFVISYDTQHDRSFTQHCQKQIFDYLKSISSNVTLGILDFSFPSENSNVRLIF